MFKSFTTLPSPTLKAGQRSLVRNNRKATTLFSQSDGTGCIKVTFVAPGRRGNNYVACLVKLSNTKYRFRLYASDGTRLNTITEEDTVAPPNVIENLVASINSNNTFEKYIRVTFLKETTEAMSDSTAIGDGQALHGGR